MAGAGFKTFTVGEVLTASDVNSYLMQQAVMAFASSGARGSAIGTATEGMLSYLADTDAVEVYDGSAWNAVGGGGGFTASTAITATDASWTVPTLADPVVRVTVVGGGGGGGAPGSGGATLYGATGGSSVWDDGTTTLTALGGLGGAAPGNGANVNGRSSRDLDTAGNGGQAAVSKEGGGDYSVWTGTTGLGGEVRTAYVDLTGVAAVSITVGAGGAGVVSGLTGGAGGDGVVIVEYRAG